MLECITSPAGTALAVACTLVLGYFAIRGIGRREEPEHLYIRLKRAKKKAAGRGGARSDGKDRGESSCPVYKEAEEKSR